MATSSQRKSREDLDNEIEGVNEEGNKRRERELKSFPGESFSDDEDEKKKVKKRPSIFRSRLKGKKEKEERKDKDGKGDEKVRKSKNKDGDEQRSKTEEDKMRSGKNKDRKEMKKRSNTISELSVSRIRKEVKPIFGVPLSEAVEETKLHDGIELPRIVRECIDFVEEFALTTPGIYRLSGIKSKVELLKGKYNEGETVDLKEYEPTIVTSLLKLYLRELPQSILTQAMHSQFEDTAGIPNETLRLDEFQKLLTELPSCHYALLSWLIVHFSHVLQNESENKMTIQNISIVMCPTMRISHRVLNLLFTNWQTLFGHVKIKKCSKPLHLRDSVHLPSSPSALTEELHNHEALLNKMHEALNEGVAKDGTEEEVWEVQRVVTQLKRKLRKAKSEAKERANEEVANDDTPVKKDQERSKSREDSASAESKEDLTADQSDSISKETLKELVPSKETPSSLVTTPSKGTPSEELDSEAPLDLKNVEIEVLDNEETISHEEPEKEDLPPEKTVKGEEEEESLEELYLLHAEIMAQQEELLNMRNKLQHRIEIEKQEVERLQTEIETVKSTLRRRPSASSGDNLSDDSSESDDEVDLQKILLRLLEDNKKLRIENTQIQVQIFAERDSYIDIKAKIKVAEQREQIIKELKEERKSIREKEKVLQAEPPASSEESARQKEPPPTADEMARELNHNSSNNITSKLKETEI